MTSIARRALKSTPCCRDFSLPAKVCRRSFVSRPISTPALNLFRNTKSPDLDRIQTQSFPCCQVQGNAFSLQKQLVDMTGVRRTMLMNCRRLSTMENEWRDGLKVDKMHEMETKHSTTVRTNTTHKGNNYKQQQQQQTSYHRTSKNQASRKPTTLAKQLKKAGEKVPTSGWIKVENISPISSLDAMLTGLQEVIHSQIDAGGLFDIDADWYVDTSKDSIPRLDVKKNDASIFKKAILILSPYGRPVGWRIQFRSRSIVHHVLSQPVVRCASKRVRVSEWNVNDVVYNEIPAHEQGITDATIRVENLSLAKGTPMTLINAFSRYDLDETPGRSSIEPWHAVTDDGRRPTSTWLVHFADASWARAALRENQSMILFGKQIVLSPYPKQIL